MDLGKHQAQIFISCIFDILIENWRDKTLIRAVRGCVGWNQNDTIDLITLLVHFLSNGRCYVKCYLVNVQRRPGRILEDLSIYYRELFSINTNPDCYWKVWTHFYLKATVVNIWKRRWNGEPSYNMHNFFFRYNECRLCYELFIAFIVFISGSGIWEKMWSFFFFYILSCIFHL